MSEIHGDLRNLSPRWRSSNTERLAEVITGVCGIRREIANQIVAGLLDSEGKTVQFETQTILAGKPDLSRTRSTWTARQVTWSGDSQHIAYELIRERRTEG